MHLGRVLEMAESSATKWEYEAKIAKRFVLLSNWSFQFHFRPAAEKHEAAN